MVPSPEEVVEVIEEVGGSPEGSVAPTEGPAGVYGEGEELSAVPWEGTWWWRYCLAMVVVLPSCEA